MILNTIRTRRFGITLRIARLAWLIAFVTVAFFVTSIIPEQKRIFLENLESKANGVAVSIRDIGAGAVVNEDYGTLVEHCLQVIQGDKTIDYLVITKNNGDSWLHDKSGWRFSQLPVEWHPNIRVSSGGIGVVPEFKRRVFHYSQPFDYSGIQWGWVHVGLSLETYDRNVATAYRRTSVLAFTCILMSLVASIVYSRLLVKPILILKSVVQRLAKGDLSARAVIDSGDEVELLADSFNGMADSLLHRDKILGSVRFAAQQFLSASDWRTVAASVLTQVGEAAEISRAYMFENHAGADEQLLTSLRFEYAVPSRMNNLSKLQNILLDGAGFDVWANCLKQGRVFSGIARELSSAEQAVLAEHRVRSILLVPIFIEDLWWGGLGFDDCAHERIWTDAEVDSLCALADMAGSAIARQKAQDGLLKAKQTLEQRVRERTQELQEQVAAKEKAHAKLTEMQQELIAASREAGMAEVATSVLHNVGNVLNSVNVSTTLVREKLQRSEIFTLGRLSRLLQEHQSDINAYLTDDPKGRMVPGFIIQLADQLETQRAELLKEHELIARNVEHIKEIVAMQQSYARVSGFLEQVSIAKLVDDALQMNLEGVNRHGIQVIRQFADVPPVTVDRHKVLQILGNLMHNAKYALDESHNQNRQLTLGIGVNGDNRVRVTVADNGIGISEENLTRIFSHRFTTRKNGHGFGLHSGANAAKEMGGQLTARSEGVGKGATFILELPLNTERAIEYEQPL